ncbi:WD40 repeat domain-containing serine/threonine protein kinase [Sinosporangium siamense]|uniref:WD40 repeat domain-containing serine/threonine protein kinase n=1 Tax=Sinosporangium siamense TaxID=1367973 RepID=UPI001951111E|nr:serine/threonine-protein kinase [Sinosporangium siamense]
MRGALVPGDPERLGGYVLASRVGEGGQGVVYEAYDEAGRRVAIKVLHSEVASRVTREVTAAGRVASFCTARLIDADVTAERPFIVSEYVDGPSLRRAVEEGGPFAGDALLRLAIATATALTAIHEAGVVHRDFKPDNVLLGPDGPRVIDFGIARTKEMSVTLPAQVAGTPAYLAPEALTDAEVGQPADVFAWGAVVVYAATGSSPFDASSMGAVLHKVLVAEPDLGMLPEPLRALAAAALTKDPAGRPTAAHLLFALLSGGHADTAGRRAELLRAGARAAAALQPPGDMVERNPELGVVAENVYATLAPGEQEVVPDVMLRMVAPGDGGADGIRRTDADELNVADAASVGGVIDKFTRAGLLVREDDGVRPAGVALLRAWPRLVTWLEAEREGLPIHRRLTEAARLWHDHGCKPGDLYQGTPLEQATQWAATGRRHLHLSDLETRFLAAGASAVRRRARVRRLLTATLATLLVITVAAGAFIEVQRRDSAAQRDLAVARTLALRAETLRDREPAAALRLSAAAWEIAPNPAVPEIKGALYGSLAQTVADVFKAPGSSAGVHALSTDGTTLASVAGGTVRVWDVVSGEQRTSFGGVGDGVLRAALSRGGRTLALHDQSGVRLWDVRTGKPVGARFGPPVNPLFDEQFEFDGTGDHLAIMEEGRSRPVWWRVADRTKLVTGGGLSTVAVSPGGRLALASSGGVTHWWNPATGARVPGALPTQVTDHAAFSGDGRVYAVAEDREGQLDAVRIWDMPKGAERLLELRVDGVNIALNDDGTLLAIATADQIAVIGTADGSEVMREHIDGDLNTQPRFSDDGRFVRVLRPGGTVYSLRIPQGQRLLRKGEAAGAVALSADGTTLALERKGTIQMFRTAGGGKLGPPIKVAESAAARVALAFSPDGRVLAVGGALTVGERGELSIALIDTAGGRVTKSFPVLNQRMEWLSALAFSPDGNTLAVSESPVGDFAHGHRPWLELWDLRTGRGRGVDNGGGDSMAFSPDGSRLLTAFLPYPAMVDTRSARVLPWPGRRPYMTGQGPVAFDPGGGIAVVPEGKGVDLWHTAPWTPQDRPIGQPGTEGVEAAAFADGGATLAVSIGNKVMLWDVRTGQPLATIKVPGWDNELAAGDGVLYVAAKDGTLTSHIVDPARAARAVCEQAGGGFSRAEWQRYAPGTPYRDICSGDRDAG